MRPDGLYSVTRWRSGVPTGGRTCRNHRQFRPSAPDTNFEWLKGAAQSQNSAGRGCIRVFESHKAAKGDPGTCLASQGHDV
jgi:hypothetical protein